MILKGRYEYDPTKDILGKDETANTLVRAYDTEEDRSVILKFFNTELYQSIDEKINDLMAIDHINLLKLYDYVEHESLSPFGTISQIKIGVVEDAGDKTLAMMDKDSRSQHAEEIVQALFDGIHHLHTNDLLHLNLNPNNIVVTESADSVSVKIADYGVLTQQNITDKAYAAPEIDLDEELTSAYDIWSVGSIAYELFTGKKATTDELDLSEVPFPYNKVLEKCLVADPSERASSIEELIATKTYYQKQFLFDQVLPLTQEQFDSRYVYDEDEEELETSITYKAFDQLTQQAVLITIYDEAFVEELLTAIFEQTPLDTLGISPFAHICKVITEEEGTVLASIEIATKPELSTETIDKEEEDDSVSIPHGETDSYAKNTIVKDYSEIAKLVAGDKEKLEEDNVEAVTETTTTETTEEKENYATNTVVKDYSEIAKLVNSDAHKLVDEEGEEDILHLSSMENEDYTTNTVVKDYSEIAKLVNSDKEKLND